jgi:hypothetical protein
MPPYFAAVFRRRLRQRHQFFLFGITAGRIQQSDRQSDRTGLHCFVHQRFHGCRFPPGGRAAVKPHRGDADRPVRHLGDTIHGHRPLFQLIDILPYSSPRPIAAIGTEHRGNVPNERIFHGSVYRSAAETAVGQHLRSHTLVKLRCVQRIGNDRQIVVRMDIDKPGTGDLVFPVQDDGRFLFDFVRHFDDFPVFDGDLAPEPRASASIDNSDIAHFIVQHSRFTCGQGNKQTIRRTIVCA